MSDNFLGIWAAVFVMGIGFSLIVNVMVEYSIEKSAVEVCQYAHQVEQCERRYVPVIKGE